MTSPPHDARRYLDPTMVLGGIAVLLGLPLASGIGGGVVAVIGIGVILLGLVSIGGGFGVLVTVTQARRSKAKDGSSPLRRRRRTGKSDRRSPGARVGGSVTELVDYLLACAASRLPEDDRERWVEEWADHRTHLTGIHLLWWALCTRVTASRTADELRHARLPHPDR